MNTVRRMAASLKTSAPPGLRIYLDQKDLRMNTDKNEPKVCPLCGRTYTEVPALSRKDNTTPICPDCGTRESLEAIGISPEEQEKVLEIIHEKLAEKPCK